LSFSIVIDKSVIGKGLENEVCILLKIACECVHLFPEQRPTMLEVYNNMNNVRMDRNDYGEESHTLRVL
jgi:hypothetical protein